MRNRQRSRGRARVHSQVSDMLLGNDTGSFPPGTLSPKMVLASALPASWPGISWYRMVLAWSTHVIMHAPGQRATTMVFFWTAVTAETSAFCQSGSVRSVRSEPSEDVTATLTMTRSAAAAACAAIVAFWPEL